MSDLDPLDAELSDLLGSGSVSPDQPVVPALLIRRARDLHEPMVGKRARFLMTSHSTDGEWLAHGWKDGLRIVSEPVDEVFGLEEPGVWIQEERDFYGDCHTTNRFAVGLSRVWVEQYVSASSLQGASGRERW